MLVLVRKKEQTIHVVEAGIVIKILAVGGKKVKIGVEAPRELKVVRGELLGTLNKAAEETQNSSDSKGQELAIYSPDTGDTFEDFTNSSH